MIKPSLPQHAIDYSFAIMTSKFIANPFSQMWLAAGDFHSSTLSLLKKCQKRKGTHLQECTNRTSFQPDEMITTKEEQ
jgi:hypothetical protein